MIRRRDVLAGAAAAGALAALSSELRRPAGAADNAWNAGEVEHLLPAANHNRILLKASLREPVKGGAVLHVDGRPVAGTQTDSDGYFWQFDATGLEPSRTYMLNLTDAGGRLLCDAWPLATFPNADDQP